MSSSEIENKRAEAARSTTGRKSSTSKTTKGSKKK